MIKLRCENPKCGRFLKITAQGTLIAEVTCPDRKCKMVNKIKVVNSKSSVADIKFRFSGLL